MLIVVIQDLMRYPLFGPPAQDPFSSIPERTSRQLRPADDNIGLSAGQAAGQTVPHVHAHVIPRYPGAGGVSTTAPWPT